MTCYAVDAQKGWKPANATGNHRPAGILAAFMTGLWQEPIGRRTVEAKANRSTQINPPTSKRRTRGRNKVGNNCLEATLDDAADWPKEELRQY